MKKQVSEQTPAQRSKIEEILAALRRGLYEIYAGRMKRLLLFGSYARGEAQEGSDIDVAVVLDDFEDALAEVERASDLVYRLCLQRGCVIALLPVREREYQNGKFPIHMNLRREGIPI